MLSITARPIGLSLILSLSALAGCSSDDDSNQAANQGTSTDGPLSSEQFVSSYAALLCDGYKPCCTKAGQPDDGAGCKFVMSYTLRDKAKKATYNPTLASKCLSDLRAANMANDLCETSASMGVSSCDSVFSGAKKPGEACSEDLDCMASEEGQRACYQGICQTQRLGKAGDQPCIGTKDKNVTTTATSLVFPDGTPSSVYICDRANESATCDLESMTCIALGKEGDACSWSTDCAPAFQCSSQQCQPRLAAGAACDSTQEDSCIQDYFCDAGSQTCKPQKDRGQACSGSRECKTQSCANGVCAAGFGSSIAEGFLCLHMN